MINIAQFGAGRIGAIHADNMARSGEAKLLHIVDVNAAAAKAIADRTGAQVSDAKTAFGDPRVQAVIIASSTDTHADLVIRAAKAGKAIFCEKPIDLSLKRVDQCLIEVEKARVPMFVGFNRRFDPSFRALHNRLRAVEVVQESCCIARVVVALLASSKRGSPSIKEHDERCIEAFCIVCREYCCEMACQGMERHDAGAEPIARKLPV